MAAEDVATDAPELTPDGEDPGKYTTYRGVLFRPDGTNVDGLRGLFAGYPCFLIGGGPSVSGLDLSLIRQRGILTAAMNNVAATVFRPHLWFAADKQSQFAESIWRDPAIMKFVKAKYLDKTDQGKMQVRRWDETRQEFTGSGLHAADCPNVFGYDHWKGWFPDSFLDDPRPSWGVSNRESDPSGRGPYLTTMLVAIWLLYWLGIRRIYLIGVDFKMREERPYCFDQAYDAGQVSRNNALYVWLRNRFEEVRPHFERRGLEIVNANPASRLDVFRFAEYEDAIAEALADFPPTVRTAGHYKG